MNRRDFIGTYPKDCIVLLMRRALPVVVGRQQTVKFELAVNLKTREGARAHGAADHADDRRRGD
jgi:hypothetical protein